MWIGGRRALMGAALLAACGARAAAGGAASGIDERALQDLRYGAEQSHSDAVLVLRDGEPVAEWYFDQDRRPIELMSALKSVVAIGVGRLLMLGEIESLDQPVCTIYPEWRQGRKRDITIRHLMNHTSGLQDKQSAGAEVYPSPDAVQLALAAELSEDPGSAFHYNNKATNLLSGIIEEVYGARMDRFFEKEVFGPLGIDEYQWYFDPSGRPYAMAGLRLHARDLAKFGQLVLNGGMWDGERLVSKEFIEEMLAQSQPYYPPYGLLWWRLPEETRYVMDEARLAELREAGVGAAEIAALEPLAGKTFATREERDEALQGVFGEGWRRVVAEKIRGVGVIGVFRREYAEIVAYYADGYLGQTLMIVPEQGIVAVRQVEGDDEYDSATDGFSDFKDRVLALVNE